MARSKKTGTGEDTLATGEDSPDTGAPGPDETQEPQPEALPEGGPNIPAEDTPAPDVQGTETPESGESDPLYIDEPERAGDNGGYALESPLGAEGPGGADTVAGAGGKTPAPDGESALTEEPAATEARPQLATPARPPRRGGFGGMLLGGILAALIGAGAAYYLLPNVPGLLPQDDALSTEVERLNTALQQAESDRAALEERIAELESRPLAEPLPEEFGSLPAALEEIEQRLAELEERPAPAAELPEEADAALDEAVAEMQERVEARLAELEEARAEIAEREQDAAEAARAAEAEAIAARIGAALDSGAPYGDLLEEYREAAPEAADLPAALTDHAADGVPTLPALQESFPQAAREALNAATGPATGDTPRERLGGFLKTQLGVRSLEPREGDDPDAILSRAEAALREGDLAQSISELEALPEPALEAMSGWIARAETRIAATRALSDLTTPGAE